MPTTTRPRIYRPALDVGLTTLEAVDAEVGSRYESIDVGPFVDATSDAIYLRLRSDDLVRFADDLHRLADQIIDGMLDARQAKMDAERHECPGCRTRIAPDEIACGSPRCERIAAQEMTL